MIVSNDWKGCQTSETNDENCCRTAQNDWNGSRTSETMHKIFPTLNGL